jgi:osmotically-inducible protein OsmY
MDPYRSQHRDQDRRGRRERGEERWSRRGDYEREPVDPFEGQGEQEEWQAESERERRGSESWRGRGQGQGRFESGGFEHLEDWQRPRQLGGQQFGGQGRWSEAQQWNENQRWSESQRDQRHPGQFSGGYESYGGQYGGPTQYGVGQPQYGGGQQRFGGQQGYGPYGSSGYGSQGYEQQGQYGGQQFGGQPQGGGQYGYGSGQGQYGGGMGQSYGGQQYGYGQQQRQGQGQGWGQHESERFGTHQPFGSGQEHMGGQFGRQGQGGPYAGRGPKGYRRSDERIQEEICDCLTAAGNIDASEIGITVRGGEVTLEGTVPERSMKRAAEDLAEQISGVKEVTNRLRVESKGGDGSSASGSTSAGHNGGGTTQASQSQGATRSGEKK